MWRIVILSAVFVQISRTSAYPDGSNGVGAYAYQDTEGNRVFNKNVQNQNLAINAAKKAYDITSNRAGQNTNYEPNYHPFGGYSGFGDFRDFAVPPFSMPNFGNGFGANSAFASGVARPGATYQAAGISPENQAQPNVNVMHFSDAPADGKPQFYSVQSSSYASSSNVNGKEVNHRGANTQVNNNGKITRYSVKD